LPKERREIWAQKEDGSLQTHRKHLVNEKTHHHILLRNLQQVPCPFVDNTTKYCALVVVKE